MFKTLTRGAEIFCIIQISHISNFNFYNENMFEI